MSTQHSAFWKNKSLSELSREEWESLCDGCGLCCLQKLEDAEDGEVYYTKVACKLLDLNSCRCSNYEGRLKQVPHCLKLTADQTPHFHWLPRTCAYRLVAENKDLPAWHHLVCGDTNAVHQAGISMAGNMLSESSVPEDEWEEHIIYRSI